MMCNGREHTLMINSKGDNNCKAHFHTENGIN